MENNQLDQDRINAKKFTIITVISTIVLFALVLIIPSHAIPATEQLLKDKPLVYLLFGTTAIWEFFVIKSVLKNSELTELNQWPYILLIVLSFASAVTIGYNAYMQSN